MTDTTSKPTISASSQWICPPYGAPTATSEVSRIAGFYCATALVVFGGLTRAEPAAKAA